MECERYFNEIDNYLLQRSWADVQKKKLAVSLTLCCIAPKHPHAQKQIGVNNIFSQQYMNILTYKAFQVRQRERKNLSVALTRSFPPMCIVYSLYLQFILSTHYG